MNTPNGAQQVIDARKKGFKPAELLIISLIGKANEINHTVYAASGGDYDWRWMVGISACIYVKPGVIWKPLALSVAKANPSWLGVYDVELFKGADLFAIPCIEDIKKPKSHWRYKLEFLPWMDYQNKTFLWDR